jgi:hypothetical protein
MNGQDGKIYVVVPISCGFFVAVEVCDGLTEAEAMAQFREGQWTMLLVAAAVAVPGVIALLFWG